MGPLDVRRRGFTLVELMIVLLLIAIIVAIAIPLILRSRMSANEGAAVAALRSISTAQVAFQAAGIVDANGDGTGDFGTLEELGTLENANSEPFIDRTLARGSRHGYEYSVEVFYGSETVDAAYSARAVPSAPGRTGVRNFYVDQTSVLRFTADGSEVGPDSPPVE